MKKSNTLYLILITIIICGCRTKNANTLRIIKSTIVLYCDTNFSSHAEYITEMHLLEIINDQQERVLNLDSSIVYIRSESREESILSEVVIKNNIFLPNTKNVIAVFPYLNNEITSTFPPDSIASVRIDYLNKGKISYGVALDNQLLRLTPEEVQVKKCSKNGNDFMCIGKELYDCIH